MESVLNVLNFRMLKYMCYCHYYSRCVSPMVICFLHLLKPRLFLYSENKSGNLSDSNNYRPIAIATITSKLLESVLLSKCSDYLTTFDNQFGF